MENFPLTAKKLMLPRFKKSNKQLKENYRPISLLPICGKILEQLIYNKMFEFLADNKLISSNHLGLKPGESCINQLLCITLLTIFINLLMTASRQELPFLTYQKHEFGMRQNGKILYKLKQNGISGNLLNVVKENKEA